LITANIVMPSYSISMLGGLPDRAP
jgi:hypothetical protein